MSKVIDDGLVHFRAKLNRHLKIVNACYAEIARLEALKAKEQPNTVLQTDGLESGQTLARGGFDNPKTAAKVYNELAKKYFGEFASLNEDV